MDKYLAFLYNPFVKNFQDYASKMQIYGATALMPDNAWAALALMSVYDTDKDKIPFKPETSSTHYNAILDEGEFTDTKEDYDNKVKVIKYAAKRMGKDISKVKFPSYEEMLRYADNNGYKYDELKQYMGPHKTIEEEIGLGNMKYEVSYQYDCEIRTYEDGTIVKIDRNSYGDLSNIFINNEDLISPIHISKTFNIKSGEVLSDRRYNNHSNKYENYDKHGEKMYSVEVKEFVKALQAEIYKKSSLGLPIKSDKLETLLEQITQENAYDVFNYYKELTNNSLIDDIRHEYGQNNLFATLGLIEKDTEKMADGLMNKMRHYYKPGSVIENFTDFIKICHLSWIIDELDDSDNEKDIFEKCAYVAIAIEDWKKNTGRTNLERDIELSDLPNYKKAEYKKLFEMYTKQIINNYQPHLYIENSKIQNDYYSGDSYNIKFEGNMVYVKNNDTGKESVVDMDKLFSTMVTIDKNNMFATMQNLPGEVLEDMSIEMNHIISKNDKSMFTCPENSEWEAGGYYSSLYDIIVTSTFSEEITVHELGHSIDCVLNYLYSSETTEFNSVFEEELAAYKEAGFTQYSKRKGYKRKERTSNYATYNVNEMFAECYTLLMLGDCQSKDVILAHFPKCLKAAEELLKQIRKRSNEERHIPN